MADQTYFHIRNREGGPETRGVSAYSLGHKIDRGPDAKPDGIFCEWSWDGQRLTAHNDRYGIYPLYYCHDRGEIYLSPSIRQILALGAPKDFDYEALSVFLRIGFFVGEDTPFKHIKILPPDAAFIYEKGALTVSGHYAVRPPIRISEDDAVDEYIRLFRQSMKKRLPAPGEKFLMQVSGGRDSRHILLELHHLGYKPDYAVTLRPYPPYYEEDIRIAKIVCEALDVNHRTLEQESSYFVNELRALEMTNYCNDEQAWFLALADHFEGKTKVNYDGLAGGIFPTPAFWNEGLSILFRKQSHAEICRTLFKNWSWIRPSDDVLKQGLGEDFFKRTGVDCAIAHLTEELKKHASAPSPVTSFYFWNRTRRKVALMPYAVNAGVPKTYSPFVDHDLYDFLAALPEELYHDRTLHDKTIARAYPRYAHIPYERNDAQKISAADHRERYVREFAWYVLKGNPGPAGVTKNRYLWPRMLKGLLNRKYCASLWRLTPPILVYLAQLEKLQRLKGKAPS